MFPNAAIYFSDSVIHITNSFHLLSERENADVHESRTTTALYWGVGPNAEPERP